MKLQDGHTIVTKLTDSLEGMTKPDAHDARALQGMFEELAIVLAAEGRDWDVTKIRKASVFCSQIADGVLENDTREWEWIRSTAQAAAKVVLDGIEFQLAGYPDSAVSVKSQAYGALVDAEIYAEFISRQNDALNDIEQIVMKIEDGRDPEDISAMMRFFHTLKGESALLGIEDMSTLAHMTEDMLMSESVSECAERLLLIKDWLAQKFQHLAGRASAPDPVEDLISRLGKPASIPVPVDWADVGIDEAIFECDLRECEVDLLEEFIGESMEHLDEAEAQLLVLESEPTHEDALNAVFRAFHTIKGVAGFLDMGHIKCLAHKAESLLEMARQSEIELSGEAMDLTFDSIDMLKKLCDDLIVSLSTSGRLSRRPELMDLLRRLDRRSDVDSIPCQERTPELEIAIIEPRPAEQDELNSGLIILRKPSEPKRPLEAKPPAPEVELPPLTQAHPSVQIQRREAVRVDADRLDLLVETIGELVIAGAMVSQSSKMQDEVSFDSIRNIDHLEKICRELQEIGMSLRMVPVRPIFQKMARVVRDLSRKLDRWIEFEMDGEDTELDKSVVDKIGDPLVHMIRNAVDHGIESDPDVRRAAGKPGVGCIKLRAFHKGGNIVIEVEDDGKGLDKDAILAKAIERGLVKEGHTMSEREIFNLIFEPGFSTANQVTDVSGRGVGMDVVRRNIDELRGSVEIKSIKGQGSVFRFRLPLTLAIIDGMVIETGAEKYIIPTLSVVRLVRPKATDYSTVREKGEMLRFEKGLIPLFRLHRLFEVDGACDDLAQSVVVVVESEGRKVGLMTDNLIGQQQIVIKNLGEQVHGTKGIAGGAIMSDGNVALILDIAGLVKTAHVKGSTPGMDLAAE